MTTLARTWQGTKTTISEHTVWATASILMSAAAINFIPVASGAIAFYAASKSQNSFLKVLSIVSGLTGIMLGVLAVL
ncbi:hypothetical protein ACFL4D_01495 [Candidatus Margulisiibacteriota bacterium]